MSIAALPNNPFKLLGWFLSALVDKINEIIAYLNGSPSNAYASFMFKLQTDETDSVITLTEIFNNTGKTFTASIESDGQYKVIPNVAFSNTAKTVCLTQQLSTSDGVYVQVEVQANFIYILQYKADASPNKHCGIYGEIRIYL